MARSKGGRTGRETHSSRPAETRPRGLGPAERDRLKTAWPGFRFRRARAAVHSCGATEIPIPIRHPTEAAISSERCLETYLQEINEVSLLTPEQEKELGRRVQSGDLEAREHLIRANLRLVVAISKIYTDRGLTLPDLIAEGNIGLMKAAEKFDPDAGCRFSTYASWWIKQSIRRSLTNTVPSVRIPGYMSEMISKWRTVSRELAFQLGRAPSVEEVAREIGVPEENWKLLKRTIQTTANGAHVSLDALTAAQDTVSDDRLGSPEEAILKADMLERLRDLLDEIDGREATILRLRYGLESEDGPLTLKEIGRRVGLTRERVRQLERQALAKLYRIMGGD